jgi:hypothetical protein
MPFLLVELYLTINADDGSSTFALR